MQKEKEQQDKLKAIKARLLYQHESGRNPRNHEESHYSESKTPTARTEPRRRHGRKHSRSPSPVASVFRRLKQNRSPSPRLRPRGRRVVCSIDWEEKNQVRIHAMIVTTRVPKQGEPRYRQKSIAMRAHRPEKPADIRRAKTSERGTLESKSKRHSQIPTKTSSHRLDSAAKTERWAMPTWCHMFNSTLTGNARVWFDKLPKESIDSYEDLRAAFRENYRQQTKQLHVSSAWLGRYITSSKTLGMEMSTKDFMRDTKKKSWTERAPECTEDLRFMHWIYPP
ncbi:reverse transcriptase domain-containing protein [Tanacetum coccineum]|uniref:Reverse transcriptase domain-containing protein n=1 Tax=Tanacetum coccineum TaxID=301880 RepID=A0ABQ5ALG3_9ASTR